MASYLRSRGKDELLYLVGTQYLYIFPKSENGKIQLYKQ